VTTAKTASGCVLCHPAAEVLLWRDARCRVILAADADHPALCRVIWNDHVREMTDLPVGDRAHLMMVVAAVERVLRDLLQPTKVNLASFGNQVPHLHWHVIPRFADDAHFPDAIWEPRRRDGVRHGIEAGRLGERLTALLVAAGG
jgi:diadenosine tetraphosphate (Ap4A) HIT family hydrolase